MARGLLVGPYNSNRPKIVTDLAPLVGSKEIVTKTPSFFVVLKKAHFFLTPWPCLLYMSVHQLRKFAVSVRTFFFGIFGFIFARTKRCFSSVILVHVGPLSRFPKVRRF